jgi:cell wall-associated NlpC family hydrolase
LSGGSAEDRLPDTRCTITPEKRERIVQAAEKRLGDPYTKADCSNFVHQVYNEAGLPYEYATTKDFPNNKDFVEVDSPQAGDVVVYERHMGIYNPENEANGNPVISSTSRRGVRYGNDTWFEGIPRYFRYKNKQL